MLAEDLQRLDRPADAAPRKREGRHAGDVLAAELHLPRGRTDLAEDRVEERGLAAAIRADHADALAGTHREAHAVDRANRAAVLHAVLHLQKWRHARRSCPGTESRPPGR